MKYEYCKYRLELVKETTTVSEYEYDIRKPNDVKDFLVNICKLDRQPQETCVLIALNSKGKIIGFTTLSVGDLNSSIMHPREIFKYLITCNACAGVLGHNHPSEDPTPSDTDIESTKRIMEAGKVIGIEIVDHVIVGNEDNYVSLKSAGYIE